MSKEQRKTLGDYLMVGGIRGKYFINLEHDTHTVPIIYQVTGIKKLEIDDGEDIDIREVILLVKDQFGKNQYYLSCILKDREATPKEIERAKAQANKPNLATKVV